MLHPADYLIQIFDIFRDELSDIPPEQVTKENVLAMVDRVMEGLKMGQIKEENRK